jgi:hypothetical protein
MMKWDPKKRVKKPLHITTGSECGILLIQQLNLSLRMSLPIRLLRESLGSIALEA